MIQITGVSKSYKNKNALQAIDIDIQQGDCFGLVGPNGAGKSTLIKILSSILQHDRGNITIQEQPLQKTSQNMIGYVPQDICLEETLTAEDNLTFFARIHHLKGKERRERMDAVLEQISLTNQRKDVVSTFSGGMKRRLNIGCALLHDPDVLIMDEPTVGIDPQSRYNIYSLIHRLRRLGKTIIYTSHYMEEVEQLCNRVAFIDHGEVVAYGSLAQIANQHAKSGVYVEFQSEQFDILKQFEHVEEKGNGYRMLTEQPLQLLEKMAHQFERDHIPIVRLEVSQPKLEDIFLQLTGTALREGDAQ
ncbi:ABC transporter ATP-binding protein [Geomicrobium sp. JCM 19039]|uniref:ABC transporter ATP-binding protein n=1 Tax=Geomicrobium sp. JCM 19039 TaxID=1460636 RepID=UPI00045F1EE7|nr:ABC transporter ATP-binding protein [Geomicrobium sp. JCM 19039]GAK14431.1 ABC transporter, ATP-binding protein [Geomicrobium sp. JCM 19039]